MNKKWRLLSSLSLLGLIASCNQAQETPNASINKPTELHQAIVLPQFTGQTYFISAQGNDQNSGSIDAPLKSINALAKRLKPGDGVYIRAGRYSEVIDITGLEGQLDKPITLVAYPGEEVIFDGSVLIEQEWQADKKGIFSTTLDRDITQLFINDEMAITARWPNASFDDDSVFDMEATWRHQGKESTFGTMVDARPKGLEEGVNQQTLAQTGIDFTGAVAVLNINAWMSYAQHVAKHEAGSDQFTYDTTTMKGNLNMLKNEKFFSHKKKLGHYYLEGLMALDAEKEWYFTPEDKKLYLKPQAGQKPQDLKIRAKVQDFNLLIKKSQHLKIQGIQFFASTLNIANCANMTVDDCHFKYPSFNKFVLGEFGKNQYTKIENSMSTEMEPSNNRVSNCVFEYADGPALKMTGYKNIVENNLFHHIDFTCIGGGDGGTIEMGKGRHTTFRYNTVHTAGNSEGYRSGPADIVEYNYLHNMSLLQHDGSAINCGVYAIKDVKVSHNWIHGLRSKAAIRFDTSSMFTAFVNWGEGGTVNHNVAWNSAGLKLKGDRHQVYNNLSFDAFSAGKTDIALPCAPLMGGYNRYSTVKNNLAGAINGHFVVSRGIPLFCKSENNLETDPRSVLRDPSNLDFRPIKTLANLGPYDATSENYWIPGYKGTKASMPIPALNAKNVKADAELMWRPAREYEAFDIYFSADKSAVEKGDTAAFRGQQSCNIFTPGKLDPQKTYYWRVDVFNKGKQIKGELWSFGGTEDVQHYDYNHPEKPIPMAKDFQLPESIRNSNLANESKQVVLDLYKRFWWDENLKWHQELKAEKAKLKPGKRGYDTVQKRLQDFYKMEKEFILEEASQKLNQQEVEFLKQSLSTSLAKKREKQALITGIQ